MASGKASISAAARRLGRSAAVEADDLVTSARLSGDRVIEQDGLTPNEYQGTMLPGSAMGAGVRPSEALSAYREAIRGVVESHRACDARVLGSVLRGEDTEGSDLDVLIDPPPETTLFDIGPIRHAVLAQAVPV